MSQIIPGKYVLKNVYLKFQFKWASYVFCCYCSLFALFFAKSGNPICYPSSLFIHQRKKKREVTNPGTRSQTVSSTPSLLNLYQSFTLSFNKVHGGPPAPRDEGKELLKEAGCWQRKSPWLRIGRPGSLCHCPLPYPYGL